MLGVQRQTIGKRNRELMPPSVRGGPATVIEGSRTNDRFLGDLWVVGAELVVRRPKNPEGQGLLGVGGGGEGVVDRDAFRIAGRRGVHHHGGNARQREPRLKPLAPRSKREIPPGLPWIVTSFQSRPDPTR